VKRKTVDTFVERIGVFRDEIVFQFKLKSVVVNDGGTKGIRTLDLLHAKQALSQLSYGPE
jgi:hypothetical protein